MNRAVQPQMAKRLEISDLGSRGIVLSVYIAKTKVLICPVTAGFLITQLSYRTLTFCVQTKRC